MTPSLTSEALTACSGLPIPTPTKTGFEVTFFKRDAILIALSAS